MSSFLASLFPPLSVCSSHLRHWPICVDAVSCSGQRNACTDTHTPSAKSYFKHFLPDFGQMMGSVAVITRFVSRTSTKSDMSPRLAQRAPASLAGDVCVEGVGFCYDLWVTVNGSRAVGKCPPPASTPRLCCGANPKWPADHWGLWALCVLLASHDPNVPSSSRFRRRRQNPADLLDHLTCVHFTSLFQNDSGWREPLLACRTTRTLPQNNTHIPYQRANVEGLTEENKRTISRHTADAEMNMKPK